MFSTTLKIILRTLYREKRYTLINITGLSLGIACCLILGLYLRSELTYDQYNINYKHIYRIAHGDAAITSAALGPMLAQEFPEIQAYVRFRSNRKQFLIRHGARAYYWDDAYTADDNVFKIFTHKIIYGDPDTALKGPDTAAVSETFARTYFGDANPLGKIITIGNGTPVKITLVFADQPDNTHLKYDVLFSYNNGNSPLDITARRQQLWQLTDYTYLYLPDNNVVKNFRQIGNTFFARNMKEQAKAMGLNAHMLWWLQPLADIHLHSHLAADLPIGNLFYIYGFAAVAVFILLVACINYINLSTARYVKRTKDVGIHKILGAGRGYFVFQFLGEAVFFTLISLVLGLALTEIILKLTPINTLLDKHLTLSLTSEPGLLGWLFGLSLVIGFISGLYPALYLSSVAPLPARMSPNKTGKAGIRLRELLVLVQFTISVGVIACTLLMASQMHYVSGKALGFEKENRVIIPVRGVTSIRKIPAIKAELLKNSHILGVSTSDHMMGGGFSNWIIKIDNNDGILEQSTLLNMSVGKDFFTVMGMRIIEGRGFAGFSSGNKSVPFVVNETLVKQRGWKEPLGKRIVLGDYLKGKVAGVVKDFHYASLHEQIEPFALYPISDNFDSVPEAFRPFLRRNILLNISGEDLRRTISFLKEKFSEFDPNHPFEYRFLDDTLNKLYMSDERLMKLTGIFAGMCIFIACLGLFGLAAFTTEQRTKEIGIRKVLGATTPQIILLLSRGILMLVLTGAIIGSLLSYLAINEWLTNFAYRTYINPLVFLLSAAVAALVALTTLALQSYKTARSNPIHALRYE